MAPGPFCASRFRSSKLSSFEPSSIKMISEAPSSFASASEIFSWRSSKLPVSSYTGMMSAISVDRRALLVSALTYLGAIVGYAITHAVGKDTNVFFATLLVLGILILTLGVGWRFLRGIVLRLLPNVLVNRLPPVSIGCMSPRT